jgi:ATP synthase subunit 6
MYSPLEQFEIFPVLGFGSFSLTNSTCLMIFVLFLIVMFYYLTLMPNHGGNIVPNSYQQVSEGFYSFVNNIIDDTIGQKHGSTYMPFIFSLFSFILVCNLLGLIPYSFTVTSHIVVTLFFSLAIWCGKLIIGIRLHGLKLFSMFLPGGSPVILIPFLVILEMITFVMTVVSLSVRLFANMMAGHILLKVFAGFAWTMLMAGGVFYFLHFLPLVILFCLMGLETGVAIVQAYVFTLLTCMYIADVIECGH